MRVVAIDTETHTFRRGNMAPKVVCLTVCDASGKTDLFVGEDIERVMASLLKDACLGIVRLTGHSIAYDFACLLHTFPSLWQYTFVAYDADAIVCTAIREKLLDIAIGEFRFHVEEDQEKKHGYDLEDLALRRFGNHLEKGADGWRLRFGELENIPVTEWPTAAVCYAKADATNCFMLYSDQTLRARHRNYSIPTQYDDSRADFALKLMSTWGICVDRNKVDTITKQSFIRLRELGLSLQDTGLATFSEDTTGSLLGGTFVPDSGPILEIHKSNKAIQAAVQKYHPNPPTTAKGNVRIDADTLAMCNWAPFDDLIEFNGIQKTMSTYLSKLHDSPIHASFYSIGAESGRTTCANPNLQNQPRLPGVRECFVPRPGMVFLAADFCTQEMRTLAQVCLSILGASRLAERYQDDPNFDPHREFAKALAAGNPDADMNELRQRAKTCNFGYPGGMGAGTFVAYARGYGLKITLQESELLREKWFKTWPEMKKYFNFISTLVGKEKQGVVKLPISGFVRAGVQFTDACNSYFQGLAAHASKRALWETAKACYNKPDSFLYGSRPVLFVHDEIICEVPEDAGHEAAFELTRIMERAEEHLTPAIPAKAEAALMRCWSKKAKPKFKNGRLVPWEETCSK